MSQLFDNVCNSFLAEYCPDPKLIRKAIDRSNLWTIEEKRAGDPIALEGEKPETCWLILEGQVEILSGGKHITWRGRGDLIGEQGSLRQLIGKPKEQLLAADIFARGPVQLARVEAAFQSKLSKPARAVWALTLAAVVNKKLEQSIGRHVRALKQMDDRDDLLRRFSEGESLRLVQTAVGENERPVQPRETIVWFSDIANFSTWSKGKRAETTAKLARKLAEIQIDLIRAHGGMIDKLMGDGVMAIWFIDTQFEKTTVPIKAIRCAQAVVSAILAELREQKLPLDLRIGMHCGEVAFGDFGAENRIAVTVLGETVNLAARYEQAKPDEGQQLGRIRISPELRHCIDKCPKDEPIPFSEKVEIKVKDGLPITIYWL